MKKFFAIVLMCAFSVTMLGSGYRADKDRIKNMGYGNGYCNPFNVAVLTLIGTSQLVNYFYPPENSNLTLTRNLIAAGGVAAVSAYAAHCLRDSIQQDARKLIDKYPSKKNKLEHAYDKQHKIGRGHAMAVLLGGAYITHADKWHKNDPKKLALAVFGTAAALAHCPQAEYPCIMREQQLPREQGRTGQRGSSLLDSYDEE